MKINEFLLAQWPATSANRRRAGRTYKISLISSLAANRQLDNLTSLGQQRFPFE